MSASVGEPPAHPIDLIPVDPSTSQHCLLRFAPPAFRLRFPSPVFHLLRVSCFPSAFPVSCFPSPVFRPLCDLDILFCVLCNVICRTIGRAVLDTCYDYTSCITFCDMAIATPASNGNLHAHAPRRRRSRIYSIAPRIPPGRVI